jgi:mannose/fructose/N-acetylgalactosamine-specific phosphotransferase system component IIC
LNDIWPEAVVWSVKALALGGLLAVDGQACLHLIASQPLVAGVLAGWAFGDAALGLTVGAYLQLVLGFGKPAGRTPGPDNASGAVVAAAVACAFAPSVPSGGGHVALGLLSALAVAWGGAKTELLRRRANETLADAALRRLRSGDEGALWKAHSASLALTFVRGALVAGVGCAAALAVGAIAIKGFAAMDFGAAFILIPCVGLASFFLGIVRTERKGLAFFAAGVVVALLAGFRVPFP